MAKGKCSVVVYMYYCMHNGFILLKKNQNENIWILLHILLNFVHSDLIEVKPAIVQVMAWCHQATSQYLI